MSTKSFLRDLLPDGVELCGKNTLHLSNGETIEIDGDPVYAGAQWLWCIDGELFSIDAYAENFLKRRIVEKLTKTRVILRAKGKVPEICGSVCPHPEHNRAICDYCPVADEARAKEKGLRLVYAVMNSQEAADIQRQALHDILKAIEDCNFGISVYEEDGRECGLEITDWTTNGVQMCHFIDLRRCGNPYDPYALLDKLQAMVDGFDPEEEFKLHIQDPEFSCAFSMHEAAVEFEQWQENLHNLSHFAWNVEKHVPDLRRGLPFANDLSYKKLLEKSEED